MKLQEWVFMVFSLSWVVIIMLDYFNKQVIYWPSISHFKYLGLFTFLGLLGLTATASFMRLGPFHKWPKLPVNGLTVFVLILITILSVTYAYNRYWQAPLDYTNYLHLIGKAFFTWGAALLLCLACYGPGRIMRKKILPMSTDTLTFRLTDLALGFFIYTLALMCMGSLGLLDQITVGLLLGIGVFVGLKSNLTLLKAILWTPLKRSSDLKWWGALVFYFMIIYITINYFYTQAPYPLGFDARNYYVNIPKLINESGALVEGFQPYAWSLVMSTGYLAFSSPEVTMFISVLGGLIALIAIYDFSKNHLSLDVNWSLAVCFLFLLTPTVTNHFMIEFKIDLALVFFQMTIISLIMTFLKDQSQSGLAGTRQYHMAFFALLGILLGYSLSIKVLSIFLIIGILVGLWAFFESALGAIGIAAIMYGLIILLKLDTLSGLRAYHLSPSLSGGILTVCGIVAFGYACIKDRVKAMQIIQYLFVLGFATILAFSPWMYKNYAYKKSMSLTTLIMGEKPQAEVKLRRAPRNAQ